MSKSPAEMEEEKNREIRLRQAIENDDVDWLHNLIVEERGLLDRVSKDPFPDTPLHFAAAFGKTQVAMEIAILKPSFARMLNAEGYSPMHLAMQLGHYHTVRALVTFDPKLIRVRGRCGFTPLHHVAKKEGDNELELLAEFLRACKSSIEVLTSRCETAVHVAVKNRNVKAFKVLFGWLKRVHLIEILSRKDEDGKTVLRIARSKEQLEIFELLTGKGWALAEGFLYFGEYIRLTVCEAEPLDPDFSRSQFLSMELTGIEKLAYWFGFRDKSARELILIVATLVTTATYQAALTPPGGYWQDNAPKPRANSTVVTANSHRTAVEKPHQAGKIIMEGLDLFQFTTFNTVAFLFSFLTVWITAFPMLPHTLPVYFLMATLSFSYFFTATIGLPRTDEFAAHIVMIFYTILLGSFFGVPIIFSCWLSRCRRRRINATDRDASAAS